MMKSSSTPRFRRTAAVAALAVLATSAGVGTTAAPAWAATPGEPILGDFNGDGLTDRVVLGSIDPDRCSTIVQYGSSPGVYLPPSAFAYLRPGGDPGVRCPDIGNALNLDDDPRDDVWIGWSGGAPAGLDFNRILLDHNFAPGARYTSSVVRPTFMGEADFDGDGSPGPYESGVGGFASFIVTGSAISSGPVKFCSIDPPLYQLVDGNRDGIPSLVMSYTRGCADGGNGVVVVDGRTGAVLTLQHDPTGEKSWTARAVNANGDRFTDIRTIEQDTGEISYFIFAQAEFLNSLVPSPRAVGDAVYLTGTRAVGINVLANDYASFEAEVIITVPPRYGTVQVTTDRTVIYRPRAEHGSTDKFTYQLVEPGKRSSTTVYLRWRR